MGNVTVKAREAWEKSDFNAQPTPYEAFVAGYAAALSVHCLQEPVAHLVWLQGRPAIDDVVDYYEVARSGDKSVDGSEPFPVYTQPIEVREQAIRECAEILNDYIAASRSDSEALGFEQARDRVLALLEGR